MKLTCLSNGRKLKVCLPRRLIQILVMAIVFSPTDDCRVRKILKGGVHDRVCRTTCRELVSIGKETRISPFRIFNMKTSYVQENIRHFINIFVVFLYSVVSICDSL